METTLFRVGAPIQPQANQLGRLPKYWLTDIRGLYSQLLSACAGLSVVPPENYYLWCDVINVNKRNSKWDFGLTGGYAIKRNLMVIGEFSRTEALNPDPTFFTYYRLLPIPSPAPCPYYYYYYYYDDSCYDFPPPIPSPAPLERRFNSHLTQFTGGIQYQVPVTVWRVAPVVGVGAGVARAAMNSQDSTVSNLSRSHSTVNFSGGARVYLSKTWGVRPEVKVMRLFSGANETVVRTSIGLFYQFRP